MTVTGQRPGRAPPAPDLRPPGLRAGLLLAACACLAGAALLAVLVGPVRLDPAGVLAELAGRLPLVEVHGGLPERDAAILWQLRLPRVVLGALVGAMLATAGAAYQGVFRNPLADPYLLGAAGGAGLGATLAIAYGPDTTGWPVGPLPLAAFVGAIAGVAAAYALGRSGGARTTTTLVLAGVAVAAFLTSVQTYVQQLEDDTLREVYGWILGRLSLAGWRDVLLILPYALLSAAVMVACRRLLDVLAVGDDEAQSLGVRAARVRLVAGSSYRLVVPLCLLLGAAFMILADLIARTVMAPGELPIGVVTAFLGAPFFAVVLRTTRRAP